MKSRRLCSWDLRDTPSLLYAFCYAFCITAFGIALDGLGGAIPRSWKDVKTMAVYSLPRRFWRRCYPNLLTTTANAGVAMTTGAAEK